MAKATTAARKTSARSKPRRAAPRSGGCTIRMYCQGLGDCFLLSFPRDKDRTGGKPVHVLIDCGVILGTADPAPKMAQVVGDIEATTGGTIDLLVVTHEHWDHVSGFVQARELFEKLKFDAVWLAWTEKKGDKLADQIRSDQQKKLKKLRAALAGARARLGAAGVAGEAVQQVESAQHVLEFFGPDPHGNAAGLAAAGLPAGKKADEGSTGAAMDWLRKRATRFCKPGERHELTGARGVQVYVLGPPRDIKKLRDDKPSHGKDEAYELRADRVGLLAALEALAGDGSADASASPFDEHYGLTAEQARCDPFFREFYGFPDDPLGDGGAPWRRIDGEWLRGAARLALQLDRGTNNTSLALAFELPGGGTLIFPGDAQVGNWQSWNDPALKFKDAEGNTVVAQELLNRAVFYKVGHHGSHNATLKKGGLEEMISGDLVAMIPVNQAMAKKKRPPKTGWKMPFVPLHRRLRELTAGRILRADKKEADFDRMRDQALADFPDSAALWKKFQRGADKQVRFSTEKVAGTSQPLYVECKIDP